MKLYNGWINLYKPFGMSSNQAVQKVRYLLGKSNKVGHAGTLDPLAEGILPIAVGEATKFVQYHMDHDKEYIFSTSWGEERDTGDAEGKITNIGGSVPTLEAINNILPDFIGEKLQVPPIYSAIKLNGQPAYKLARNGKEFVIEPRKVKIYSLEILAHFPDESKTTFKVSCGKGTYVRSLAVDIARKLSTYGYVSFLQRTKVGAFSLDNRVLLEDDLASKLVSVDFGLDKILVIEVSLEQATKLRNGLGIFLACYAGNTIETCLIYCQGKLQAIAKIENGVCKITRGINLE